MRAQFVVVGSVLLQGCVSGSTSRGRPFPTDCRERVVETLGAEDASQSLGFSATDVAAAMTAVSTGSATLADEIDAELPIALTTAAEVAVGPAITVVDREGTGSCPQGQALRMGAILRTTGTIDGWNVSAEDAVTVYAEAAAFDGVYFSDEQDQTAGDVVSVPEELGAYFQELYGPDYEALDVDPGTWEWSLGPSVAPGSVWPDAVGRSKLAAFTSVNGADYAITLARYEAAAP